MKKIKISVFLLASLLVVEKNIVAQSTQATNNYNAFNFLGWGTSSGDLPFKVNNATKMTLKNTTGYLGVGTTSPTTPVEIDNPVNGFSVPLSITNSYSGSGVGAGLYFRTPNATAASDRSWGTMTNNSVHGDFEILESTSNSTNPTVTRVTFASGGNVGIGTTSPGALLEVAGQVKITGGTPGAGKILTSDVNGLASWSTVGANGGWSTTGNASTVDGTNFIGTTDNIPFNIRVNNQKAGRIDAALFNTFLGYRANNATNIGGNCTAIGHEALFSNTSGASNTATGVYALLTNISGSSNTANGVSALYNNTGSYNTAIGNEALRANTGGANNAACGMGALYSNTSGTYNTAMGMQAILNNTTGDNNTALGYNAYSTGTYSNSMALGANAYAITANNMITVGDANITYAGIKVGWTTISDARVKKDVKENVPGLAFIKALRPVTYYYDRKKENEILGLKDTSYWEGKYDIDKIQFSGFLAQEVDVAAKKLGYDFSGVSKTNSLWGLKYGEFTVPLVKAVQEQQNMIDSLKLKNATLEKKMDHLVSIVNECCRKNKSTQSNNSQLQSPTKHTDIELSSKNFVILGQNVPNPFAEQTTINYFLPDNVANAQLVFFDQSGKIIRTVDLTEKGKGTLDVFARDLSNGIYTYSLIIDGQTTETRKMIRTK